MLYPVLASISKIISYVFGMSADLEPCLPGLQSSELIWNTNVDTAASIRQANLSTLVRGRGVFNAGHIEDRWS